MLVIDTHTHVISPDEDRYPTDPIGGHRSTWSQDHPVDLDGLLHALDDAGIDRAVVVQASTVYGHDNRYLADSVAAHPDRLTGVYSLDATAPDAVDRINHWQSRGLNGFRLFTTGTTMPGQADWLGHPDSYPAWEHAEKHDIPICLQMTIHGIPALRTTLDHYPRTRVLLDHCARPDLTDGPPYHTSQALLDLAQYPGVHLKLTHRALDAATQGASTIPDFLTTLHTTYGPSRIMWGSNYPAAQGPLTDLLTQARTHLTTLPETATTAILGGTANTFYFHTPATPATATPGAHHA
ncbi:putative amidohydrolase [Actinacidiphila reveromycinica]|uniref:Putative amidohydrolase n=1 Tax=Actinacidiphila reveromycinica TaxID=659352 RepID=A0A7U3UN61_9ACTN|nr:amidohydrolase family protein [Streptomyces sp. SN-593]BBA95596.1 putative amidohydrolase [Streptomyces sp. SN-593]